LSLGCFYWLLPFARFAAAAIGTDALGFFLFFSAEYSNMKNRAAASRGVNARFSLAAGCHSLRSGAVAP
jgi:hypothetical protein